jgi:hypothetical protein
MKRWKVVVTYEMEDDEGIEARSKEEAEAKAAKEYPYSISDSWSEATRVKITVWPA